MFNPNKLLSLIDMYDLLYGITDNPLERYKLVSPVIADMNLEVAKIHFDPEYVAIITILNNAASGGNDFLAKQISE